jgi:hypothetical protein
LFNGEYYVQQVRGVPESQIAEGLRLGSGAKDTLHPDFQAGSGCLIDQLLGQYMADLAGLGPLLNESHMRTALASIYKYNNRKDMNDSPSVERAFAMNDEKALVMCDYGKSERPEIPFPYYSENFTGSEYAVAILMLRYGMVREGEECITNIRARYDGEKANPYNEAEYGRHYARAMASWGAIPMLSGFHYNGVTRELEIEPLVQQPDFRCFWSAAAAWGSLQFNQKNGYATLRLEPARGTIEIRQLKLSASAFPAGKAKIVLGDQTVPCRMEARGRDTVLILDEAVRVTATIPLTVSAD